MATREQVATLRYFAWSEFKYPGQLHFPLLQFLDEVRHRFGFPLTVTSDFRDSVPTGGSDTSLHRAGRAVDLRWILDRHQRFRLVEILMTTPIANGEALELGLEPGAPGGPHFHVGLWPAGRPASLFVR